MIIAQAQAFLKAERQLQGIFRMVEQDAEKGERIDRVERELFSQLLAIGQTLLEAFVAAQGKGDEGATIERDDQSLQRLDQPHARRYLSIFGELQISRWVYAIRTGQKIEYAPWTNGWVCLLENFRMCWKTGSNGSVCRNRSWNRSRRWRRYPIGSGVAEGACRHLVKDRLEGTGMRWTVPGAQSMLHLRAIYLNGCWQEYLNYHIEAEQARLYRHSAA